MSVIHKNNAKNYTVSWKKGADERWDQNEWTSAVAATAAAASGTKSGMAGMAAAIPICWNLGIWFSGKSLKLLPPDVRFKGSLAGFKASYFLGNERGAEKGRSEG